MLWLKNSVYVEVFGETAGGRLLRLNNVEWRRGEKLKLQMIPARMSLDSIIQYVSVKLKINSKNEAHVKDRHNHGNRKVYSVFNTVCLLCLSCCLLLV